MSEYEIATFYHLQLRRVDFSLVVSTLDVQNAAREAHVQM